MSSSPTRTLRCTLRALSGGTFEPYRFEVLEDGRSIWVADRRKDRGISRAFAWTIGRMFLLDDGQRLEVDRLTDAERVQAHKISQHFYALDRGERRDSVVSSARRALGSRREQWSPFRFFTKSEAEGEAWGNRPRHILLHSDWRVECVLDNGGHETEVNEGVLRELAKPRVSSTESVATTADHPGTVPASARERVALIDDISVRAAPIIRGEGLSNERRCETAWVFRRFLESLGDDRETEILEAQLLWVEALCHMYARGFACSEGARILHQSLDRLRSARKHMPRCLSQILTSLGRHYVATCRWGELDKIVRQLESVESEQERDGDRAGSDYTRANRLRFQFEQPLARMHLVEATKIAKRCAEAIDRIDIESLREFPAALEPILVAQTYIGRILVLSGEFREGLDRAQQAWIESIRIDYGPAICMTAILCSSVQLLCGKYEVAQETAEEALANGAEESPCWNGRATVLRHVAMLKHFRSCEKQRNADVKEERLDRLCVDRCDADTVKDIRDRLEKARMRGTHSLPLYDGAFAMIQMYVGAHDEAIETLSSAHSSVLNSPDRLWAPVLQTVWADVLFAQGMVESARKKLADVRAECSAEHVQARGLIEFTQRLENARPIAEQHEPQPAKRRED